MSGPYKKETTAGDDHIDDPGWVIRDNEGCVIAVLETEALADVLMKGLEPRITVQWSVDDVVNHIENEGRTISREEASKLLCDISEDVQDAMASSGFAVIAKYLHHTFGVDQRVLDTTLYAYFKDRKGCCRISHCLEQDRIKTFRDLLVRSGSDLLELQNFGETSLRTLREHLAEMGLKLRGD